MYDKLLKTLVFTWLTRRGRLQQDVHRMSWLSCQPKLVAQRISSDVPNGLVPLTQRPPSAVPQRSAVGCLGRESVVATDHARCVGPWDPLVACWVPLTPARAPARASSGGNIAPSVRFDNAKLFRGRDAAKSATLPLRRLQM